MDHLYIYKLRPEYARYLFNKVDRRVSEKWWVRPYVGTVTMDSGVEKLAEEWKNFGKVLDFDELFERKANETLNGNYLEFVRFDQPPRRKLIREDGFKSIDEAISIAQERDIELRMWSVTGGRIAWEEILNATPLTEGHRVRLYGHGTFYEVQILECVEDLARRDIGAGDRKIYDRIILEMKIHSYYIGIKHPVSVIRALYGDGYKLAAAAVIELCLKPTIVNRAPEPVEEILEHLPAIIEPSERPKRKTIRSR